MGIETFRNVADAGLERGRMAPRLAEVERVTPRSGCDLSGWMEWWSLVQNEWVKFRGRRRHWIALGGVVVLAGMAAMVMGSPSSGVRSSHIESDRREIRSMVGELRTAHGSARTWDNAQLLLARYDLAELTRKPLPPLEPIVRATGALTRAENRGNRANFTAALDEWQQSRYRARAQSSDGPIVGAPYRSH